MTTPEQSSTSNRGLWITIAVAALVIGGLVGWLLKPASGDAAPAPTVTVSVTPAPDQTESDEAPRACWDSELDVTVTEGNAGSGMEAVEITFVNTGPAACVLAGYPLVDFQWEDQPPMGVAPLPTEGMMPTLVTMQPGAAAYAMLSGPNPETLEACDSATPRWILVLSPGGTTADVIEPNPFTLCVDDRGFPLPEAMPQISPVVLR